MKRESFPTSSSELVDPFNAAAPLERRARSYLHVHCSHCHRPGGVDEARMDLRADVSLAEMGICDAKPSKPYSGLPRMSLITPGQPGRSLLSLRMHRQDLRMPPVGDHDPAGAELIDGWIRSLERCVPESPLTR